MHDNILSTEASDTVYDAEQHANPDLREDDRRDNGQKHKLPLGVELTGYRLLTTSVILGFGVPKAVYSYNGQSLISTTLDWLAGVVLALVLYWLGVIEATRPGLSPCFFKVDLAPPILRFLSRSEVHLWFLSVLPLLSTTTQLRAMLDARRDDEHASRIPAHVNKDGLTLAMLAFSTTVCIFCLQSVKAVWPRGFRGEHHNHDIYHRNKCTEDVGRHKAACSPVCHQCSNVVSI
ncbi:hypothetical protein DFH94DRAFT_405760 [Russula ochroleuca]|uniref:Uncharacterized protein n=1 Tax=Russula ochroleuca TaxID=152965 RepID=A0A9P5MYG7_9AGAM|nr:hypothetical protein DFH94DRAFT_405760 [Russula ochroleuca]